MNWGLGAKKKKSHMKTMLEKMLLLRISSALILLRVCKQMYGIENWCAYLYIFMEMQLRLVDIESFWHERM